MERRRALMFDSLAEVEGIPPLTLPNSKGKPLKNYKLYGKSVQNGTPTPSAPIEVMSVGEKTSNLFDMQYDVGYTGSYPNITTVAGGKSTEWIETSQFGNYFYYIWNVNTKTASCVLGVVYSNDKSEILYRDGMINSSTVSDINIDIPAGGGAPYSINHNYSYVKFYFINWQYVNRIGVYTTSTTTFIPYGYKIPILQASNCGVVDLGTLTWIKEKNHFYASTTLVTPIVLSSQIANCYSQGYTPDKADNVYYDVTDLTIAITRTRIASATNIRIKNDRYSTPTDFKSAMSGKYLYYQRQQDTSWQTPTITNIYLNAPLQKIGTYTDGLESNGTVTRGVGVKVLDGTENWATYTYQSNPNAFYIILSDMIDTTASTQSSLFMNTHFGYVPTMWGSENVGYAVSTMKRMFFRRNDTDTVDDWKSWLAAQKSAGTPVVVYYPLATQTTEQITAPTIATQKGTNILSTATTVLPSNMSAKYIK